MPLGQTVCGTERCFIPLAGPFSRKMGKTPTIYHEHTRELIHVTRNCSSQERQIFHIGAVSPSLIHDNPGRSRAPSRHPPSPEDIELCRPDAAFAAGGIWDSPASPTRSRWGGGQGQRAGGLHRSPCPPCRNLPCLAAEHACHCREMGGRAGRTASSLRRVISCHQMPVPELWLWPGGSKRSR